MPLPSVAFTHCASFKIKFVILVVWAEETWECLKFPLIDILCRQNGSPHAITQILKTCLATKHHHSKDVKCKSNIVKVNPVFERKTTFDNISATSKHSGTTYTSCLCKLLLHWYIDTMSRMQSPVWLDNNQAKHLARLHWSCHLGCQVNLQHVHRYLVMPYLCC